MTAGRRDDAVSSIVAAVLLFALLTTAATLWTFTTLPLWIAEREQQHGHEVQEAFGAMRSGLDALSAGDDAGPSSFPVDLAAAPVPMLQRAPAQGELSLDGAVRLQASFDDELLLVADGAATVTPDEDITEGAGPLLSDVVSLESLVVLLRTANVGNDDEAFATVVASDGTDSVTAVLTHAGKLGGAGPNAAGCLNSELRLEVTVDMDPFAPVTTTQALLCELAADLTGYSVDLASPLYEFGRAADRLQTPFSVRLTDGESGGSAQADGSFGAAYVDAAGIDRGLGSGQSIDLAIDRPGSRLAYVPSYQEFAGPAVAWEFGATLLAQGDDAAIAAAPGFELTVADGVATLTWTLVTLDGSGAASGADLATVQVGHEGTRDLVLDCAGATFTLTSPQASAWRGFLEDRILLAGADGEATVGGTGTTATLTVGGGAIERWTVHVRLVDANVLLR
jgi:hypothetical protein